jgi:hypothetical protein
MELLPLSLLRVAACSGLIAGFSCPSNRLPGLTQVPGMSAGKPPVVRWRLL